MLYSNICVSGFILVSASQLCVIASTVSTECIRNNIMDQLNQSVHIDDKAETACSIYDRPNG